MQFPEDLVCKEKCTNVQRHVLKSRQMTTITVQSSNFLRPMDSIYEQIIIETSKLLYVQMSIRLYKRPVQLSTYRKKR